MISVSRHQRQCAALLLTFGLVGGDAAAQQGPREGDRPPATSAVPPTGMMLVLQEQVESGGAGPPVRRSMRLFISADRQRSRLELWGDVGQQFRAPFTLQNMQLQDRGLVVSVVDRAASRIVSWPEQLPGGLAAAAPLASLAAPWMLGRDAEFPGFVLTSTQGMERRGERQVAGLTCMEWHQPESDARVGVTGLHAVPDQTFCATADGVILRIQYPFAVLEATTVLQGTLPDSLFAPSPDHPLRSTMRPTQPSGDYTVEFGLEDNSAAAWQVSPHPDERRLVLAYSAAQHRYRIDLQGGHGEPARTTLLLDDQGQPIALWSGAAPRSYQTALPPPIGERIFASAAPPITTAELLRAVADLVRRLAGENGGLTQPIRTAYQHGPSATCTNWVAEMHHFDVQQTACIADDGRILGLQFVSALDYQGGLRAMQVWPQASGSFAPPVGARPAAPGRG